MKAQNNFLIRKGQRFVRQVCGQIGVNQSDDMLQSDLAVFAYYAD